MLGVYCPVPDQDWTGLGLAGPGLYAPYGPDAVDEQADLAALVEGVRGNQSIPLPALHHDAASGQPAVERADLGGVRARAQDAILIAGGVGVQRGGCRCRLRE